MSKKAKLERIRNLKSEKVLREDILKILLNKMGYKRVTINHGPNEQGKDIVFFDLDQKTEEEIPLAIVAKLGPIKGGSKADEENIVNVSNQIKLAFETPWEDPLKKFNVYIHKVWVVNNGPISNLAARQIIDLFGDNKGIIERNVKFYSETELLSLLDKHWPDFFLEQEPYLLEYMGKLHEESVALNELKSFGYSRETKSLIDVFIEPSLIKEKPAELRLKGKKSKTSLLDPPYENVSLSSAISKSSNIWIVGQAGSGKSTVIRNMMLTISEDARKNAAFNKIPIFFRFKDMIKNGQDVCHNLEAMIVDKFSEYNPLGYRIDPVVWLREGRVVVFLDGLDEVPISKGREVCLEEVERFCAQYPKSKIICSSRDVGFNKIKPRLSGFDVVEILPFNFSQMKKFVTKWFKDNKSASNVMMGAVKSAVVAGHLPKTPMVLTLLAVLLEENAYKELPANLTDLYSMFTELFLGKWDVQRNIQHMFDYNIKRNVLMEIAYFMHNNETDNMDADEFIKKIDEYSSERRVGLSGTEILKEIEERSGLILRLDNRLAFKHFSFQEYFAAKKWEIIQGIEKEIPEKVLNPWWQNVVFYYVGAKKDAPNIISDVINKAEPRTQQDVFNKIMNIGQLLQAGYLTNHKVKVEAINYVIKDYYRFFEEVWSEFEKEEERPLSKFMLLFVFKHFFGMNYASMTLHEAMEEVFESYWKEDKDLDNNSLLASYVTAYALALLEIFSKYEQMATSNTIKDPLFIAMLDLDMIFLKGEYDAKFDQKAINKVKKKVTKNMVAIKKYLE